MKVEQLLRILDGIQNQIRFLDTKAQIVLGIDGVLAGFVGLHTKTIALAISDKCLSWPNIGLEMFYAAYLIALVLSLFWALKAVYPRTEVKQPKSRIFFIHIAKEYQEDYKKISTDLSNMSNEELSEDVSKQILANSRVGLEKYESFKKAVVSMAISVFCWVSILALLFVVPKA